MIFINKMFFCSFTIRIPILLVVVLRFVNGQIDQSGDHVKLKVQVEDKLSEKVHKLIEHFKRPDSFNVPLPIPDPIPMPNRTYILLAGLHVLTTDVRVRGVSRLRIDDFVSDIVAMKLEFNVRIPRVEVFGNYTAPTLLMTYEGGFNVTIINSNFKCKASLEITRLGQLEAATIHMELIHHDDIELDFQNLGFFSAAMKMLGVYVFESFNPYMFGIINNNVRGNINECLGMLKLTFPNSIVPLDLAIAEARKYVREQHYDPHYLSDYHYSTNIYNFDVTQITIIGLSSFYRTGDVKGLLSNRTAHITVNVGTEILECSCMWEVGVAGIFTKAGTLSFSVEFIQVEIGIKQSLDIRKKPEVTDLHVKLGNIQLRNDGAGTIDYIMELAVNVLPNLLRYQFITVTEPHIKRYIQNYFNSLDTEKFIVDMLPLLDDQLSRNSTVTFEENFGEGLAVSANELEQGLIL